jgi:hypothetical protein
MNFDLNQFLKWDLSITIGAKTYTIKPMTLADFASVQEFDTRAEKSLDDFAALGSRFVVEPIEPALSALEWSAMFVAIVSYAAERGGKNFKATASKITDAVAIQVKTGTATAHGKSVMQ